MSATKPILKPFKVVDNQHIIAHDFASAVTSTGNTDFQTYEITVDGYAGNLQGTVYLQGSNSGITWVDLDSSTINGADVEDILSNTIAVDKLRLYFNYTSGDGYMTSYIYGKGF